MCVCVCVSVEHLCLPSCIDLVGGVFVSGPGDRGSILG